MTNSMLHNVLIRKLKLILSDKINTPKIIFMTDDWLSPIPLKALMTNFSVLNFPKYCVLKINKRVSLSSACLVWMRLSLSVRQVLLQS